MKVTSRECDCLTVIMTFLEHLDELKQSLMKIFAVFLANFVFFFAFGFTSTNIGGFSVVIPYPTMDNSFSVFMIKNVWRSLVPSELSGVTIQSYATLTGGMMTLMYMAMFLSLAFSMPWILWQFGKFISPALKPKEKKIIIKTIIPATILFFCGILFCYYIILPFTIRFLLGIIIGMDAVALITVNDFINFVILFTLPFGIIFELPIIIYGISRLGVVDSKFWKKNWRYAFVLMILFGGFITPDGSGITQLMIALTMISLYLLGYLLVRHHEKKYGNK